jgi:predicted phosphodiesterase
MPSVAIISDIHANLPALDAVLQEIDNLGVERILCCGDLVGYGPHPRECVEVLRQRNIPCVLGNHDHYTLQVRDNAEIRKMEQELRRNAVWAGIFHAVDQLGTDDFLWLEKLPTFLQLPQAIIGHAAMHDIENWPYLVDDPDILTTLDELESTKIPLGFFGHSHGQEWFTTSPKGLVKRSTKKKSVLPAKHAAAVVVGSVGQPRTGDPRAAWTLWTPEENGIEFRKTLYPIEETISDIKTCGLPAHSAERLLFGE